MKSVIYILIATFLTNTAGASTLADLNEGFRTQKMSCKPMRLHSLNLQERQKLITRRKLQINHARFTEDNFLTLAQESRNTSRASKAVGFLGVTPLLMAGATLVLGAGAMASTSLFTVAGIGAFAEQTLPFIAGAAILSANGYILYKDGKFVSAAVKKEGVNTDLFLASFQGLLNDMTTKSCDLSDIHAEILKKREELSTEMGTGLGFKVKNAFGGKAAKVTAGLYTLSVIDRMVYEMELYQLENSGARESDRVRTRSLTLN